MKNLKRKIFLLITICTIFTSTISFAIPKPTSDYFLDELNVLSQSTKDSINNTNKELEKKTKAQIVVVTIKDLEDKEPEDYALKLGRSWGVGDEKERNGVVILVGYEPTTEKYRTSIQIGYGLEGALNDAKVGRIIDNYLIPNFDKNNIKTLDKGLNEVFNAVVSQVVQEYNIELTGDYSEYSNELEKENDNSSIGRIIITIIIIIILSSKFGGNNRNNRSRRGGGFFGGFGGGYYGGSFGGGSSSGRSSGGGGFSGGGGSFGGGGASRDL